MPNKYIAQHPRFIANVAAAIPAPFAVNAFKAYNYTVKGLTPDMVIVATIDGDSGVVVVGASCLAKDRVSVIYRNNGAAGRKGGMTLTVVGL